MARIDWNNLTFSGKELITIGSFCFAISGLYYKTIITDSQNEQKYIAQTTAFDKRMMVLEDENKSLKIQIRVLQDNDLKRTIIEESQNESSNGYLPLKKR